MFDHLKFILFITFVFLLGFFIPSLIRYTVGGGWNWDSLTPDGIGWMITASSISGFITIAILLASGGSTNTKKKKKDI